MKIPTRLPVRLLCGGNDPEVSGGRYNQDIDLIRSDTELEFLIKEPGEFIAIFTSALKTLNKS